MGYVNGSWADSPTLSLTNDYFNVLLNTSWQPVRAPGGDLQYSNADGTRFMTANDLQILWDPVLRDKAVNFASDAQLFTSHFKRGWSKMMNADRFAGPASNPCE